MLISHAQKKALQTCFGLSYKVQGCGTSAVHGRAGVSQDIWLGFDIFRSDSEIGALLSEVVDKHAVIFRFLHRTFDNINKWYRGPAWKITHWSLNKLPKWEDPRPYPHPTLNNSSRKGFRCKYKKPQIFGMDNVLYVLHNLFCAFWRTCNLLSSPNNPTFPRIARSHLIPTFSPI